MVVWWKEYKCPITLTWKTLQWGMSFDKMEVEREKQQQRQIEVEKETRKNCNSKIRWWKKNKGKKQKVENQI